MADVVATAEIRMWGTQVGAVAELSDGQIIFEYAEAFRRSGWEISPLKLPLRLRSPVQFAELRSKEAFRGLPGVLADALPDSFGTQVIRAYYTSRGQIERAFSPVQHLLYVGQRAIGALTFHPAEDLPVQAAEVDALEIARLVADARRIVEGEVDVAVPEIFRIGSSAGGMRPKAVVLFNPATQEVRSAFCRCSAGRHPGHLEIRRRRPEPLSIGPRTAPTLQQDRSGIHGDGQELRPAGCGGAGPRDRRRSCSFAHPALRPRPKGPWL